MTRCLSVWKRFSFKTIAVALLAVLMTCCAPSWRGNGASEAGIPVRFLHVDSRAASVCVAGSFNQWSSQSHCMRREGSTWSVTLSLPPGRYEYAFVVDGDSWQTDPGAPLVEESGFGRMNSVLVVE
jgi:1,4-alpha-glucan branching enzyme